MSISSSSDSITAEWSMDKTVSTNINVSAGQIRRARPGCNESKKHDNDEKALFHGLKSAFRMSRAYDGKEYGSQSPQHATAAHTALGVALSYIKATDQEITREASYEYIESQFLDPVSNVERKLLDVPLEERMGVDAFEDAIDYAWMQVDEKENHYDAARNALFAAELFLGVRYDDI